MHVPAGGGDRHGWLFVFLEDGLNRIEAAGGPARRVVFYVRKRIGYRNSFQSLLKATLRPDGAGTVISGAIAIHPFIQAFMFAWFLIGGAMLIARVSALFTIASLNQNAVMVLGIPLFMLLLGLGLVLFGRHVARDEPRFLVDCLKRTLDALE